MKCNYSSLLLYQTETNELATKHHLQTHVPHGPPTLAWVFSLHPGERKVETWCGCCLVASCTFCVWALTVALPWRLPEIVSGVLTMGSLGTEWKMSRSGRGKGRTFFFLCKNLHELFSSSFVSLSSSPARPLTGLFQPCLRSRESIAFLSFTLPKNGF